MSLIEEVLMMQDLRRHFPRNSEQVKPVKRVPTIINKKKPNKTYTRELLKVNEKMPNKFIAREKPPLDSKFVPFVNENFSNKKYNKKRRMKKMVMKSSIKKKWANKSTPRKVEDFSH